MIECPQCLSPECACAHLRPRPPGRPPKVDADKLKQRAVRFTDAEWAEVRKDAEAAGKTLAELVRSRALLRDSR